MTAAATDAPPRNPRQVLISTESVEIAALVEQLDHAHHNHAAMRQDLAQARHATTTTRATWTALPTTLRRFLLTTATLLALCAVLVLLG